jgi:hypothetical protein
MSSIAVVSKDEKTVDILYPQANGRNGIISLPMEDFITIKKSFAGENCLMVEHMAIDMTAITDYVEETDPTFVQSAITIETDRVRRSMGSSSLSKYILPIGICLFILIIIMMLTGGGGGSGTGTYLPDTSAITGNVVIK